MKKVRFIYNPASGDNRILYALDDILSIYQHRGYQLEPFRLTFQSDDEALLGDPAEAYHHLLIAGGDGTVNHVVNLLKSSGRDIPVAVLPTGTANDFARLIGMPSDIPTACKRLLGGEIVEFDLGRANDRYFVNVFSSGLFTDVSQKTPTLLKNTFGKLAYYLSGLGELPNFRHMQLRVESDGKALFAGSALMLFVFNGQTAGSLKIAYLSDVRDGLLDVLIVRGENIGEALRTAAGYMRPTSGRYPKDVVHLRCSELTIHSLNGEATDMDGEAGPDFPVRIECVPRGLKVLCPKSESRAKRTTVRSGAKRAVAKKSQESA